MSSLSTAPVVTVDRQDPRFATLKKGHNLRFPSSDSEAAGRIFLCSSAEEIQAALQHVITAGLRPTVRSGGHCYEDFVANNPNGAILDISMHNAVSQGPSGGFRVAPGAVLGEVYQALYKRGNVTLPAGTCYMVGAGGHISGGGYGLLSRLHGLTVDWISAVDILTVDAHGHVTPLTVSANSHPDLFRACRGAGNGNFGVITAFHFDRLPVAPREVALVSLSFPWKDLTEAKFTRLLILYGEYFATRGQQPDTWGLFTVMTMGAAHREESHIGIHIQFCTPNGDTSDLAVLHEFCAVFHELDPTLVLPTKLPAGNSSSTAGQQDIAADRARTPYEVNREHWLDATLAEGGSGGGSRAKYKSSYMKNTFTPAECAAIYRFFNDASFDSHGAVLAIDSYGGAINKPERAADTAIAQRSSILKLQWQTYWRDQQQDAGRLRYTDDFFTAVYTGPHVDPDHQGTPFGPGFEGCYMNYPDVDMLRYSFWPQLFWGRGDLYPFLQQVKSTYDPHNVFHHSMSVRALEV